MEFISSFNVDVGQQALFDSWKKSFNNNHYAMFIVLLTLAHSIPYYGWNLFYTAISKFYALDEYRWLGSKRADHQLVKEAIYYTAALHILSPIGPIFGFGAAVAHNPTMFTDPVPGILTCLAQIPLAYLVTDFFFYMGHRLLHEVPWLYKNIHKKHHEFNVTVGWACEYAHWAEWLFGNVAPVLAGPILFKYHFFMWVVWLSIAITGTTWGHSGFKFPLALSNGSHDFHHSHNVGNYGSMKHWDIILGTDKAYRAHLKREAEKKKAAEVVPSNTENQAGSKKKGRSSTPKRKKN